MKLLNSNSSWRSVSNGHKARSKNRDSKSKGLQKKRMKLKNLMSTNAIRPQVRKVKHPKFGDIGMNLWNKKKSYINTDHNENSHMIDINNNLSYLRDNKGTLIVYLHLENINSNINLTTTKSLMSQAKSKKSLSRIKSNNFSKNINTDMRTWASNYNLRKQSARKRRSGNSTATNSKLHNKSVSKSYYTHRATETSKRASNAQILADITDQKRHCESTANSDKKYLLHQNIESDKQKIIQRDLLLKRSGAFNNGSQTVRNHDEDKMLDDSFDENTNGMFYLVFIYYFRGNYNNEK